MRLASILALLLAILASACLAASPKEGQPAPPFAVKTLDGRQIDSADLKGKVVLLHFWATWCPPCREELPALDAFYRQHRDEGLEILAISIEDAADAAKVQEFAQGYAFPAAMIGDARLAGYGRVWALPLSFLIDRDGTLRKGDWTGAEKIDAVTLDKLVLPLLGSAGTRSGGPAGKPRQ